MVKSVSCPTAEITGTLPSEEEYVSAFMPCTPNPTTGFFFYVLRREVIELGAITPPVGLNMFVIQGRYAAVTAETSRVQLRDPAYPSD